MSSHEHRRGPARPRCASCRDVIGVYELAWAQTEDGRIGHQSVAALGPRELPGVRAWWHRACLEQR